MHAQTHTISVLTSETVHKNTDIAGRQITVRRSVFRTLGFPHLRFNQQLNNTCVVAKTIRRSTFVSVVGDGELFCWDVSVDLAGLLTCTCVRGVWTGACAGPTRPSTRWRLNVRWLRWCPPTICREDYPPFHVPGTSTTCKEHISTQFAARHKNGSKKRTNYCNTCK